MKNIRAILLNLLTVLTALSLLSAAILPRETARADATASRVVLINENAQVIAAGDAEEEDQMRAMMEGNPHLRLEVRAPALGRGMRDAQAASSVRTLTLTACLPQTAYSAPALPTGRVDVMYRRSVPQGALFPVLHYG